MNTIFLVLDSLNRHFLSCCGGSGAVTPNIDRLARQGIVFDNHYAGSLPCMPARREMMTGRVNFLEAPWGPIEPWDRCLPTILRERKGTYSHMITDHYHYFHSGGEAYNTLFDSWEFERGQEGDTWRPAIDCGEPPFETRGKGASRGAYWRNRSMMDPEDDLSYSTPRCFQRAIEFVELNRENDNWHLHLEVFDPHEPFDCPSRYHQVYGDTWDRYYYTWPDYGPLEPEKDDAEAVEHIRKSYAATLTMADEWLGRFLDAMDRSGLWKDTTLILTTDHGHLLGEHGYWAKNYMFDYLELSHIPMIIRPADSLGAESGGGRASGITATIDHMPTLLDLHGCSVPDGVHGRSYKRLFGTDAPEAAHHDAVLYGYFGKDINLFDGRYTYCRQPEEGSTLFHHTAMPRGFRDFIPREILSAAEFGRFLESADGIPHYRIETVSKRHLDAPSGNPIYDALEDPRQMKPISDPVLERKLGMKMREMLERFGSPPCQYRRMNM